MKTLPAFSLISCIRRNRNSFLHLGLIILIFLVIALTLFDGDSQSLLAHDEGLYARRAKFVLESGNWLSPFTTPHHKTVGSYWPIAVSLNLFGISDWAARLPSIFSGLVATIFFYLMSRKYFKPLNSLAASFALLAMPIYFQSLRTAGPDMTFTALVMAQIYLFVTIKDSEVSSSRWKIVAFGACISLTFFVRSMVAFLPIVSMLPLIFSRRYSRVRTFWFWTVVGLLLGSIPLILNLYAVFADHGYAGVSPLIKFASNKADLSELNLSSGIPFYFSRLLLLTFPFSICILSRIKIRSSSFKISALLTEINSLSIFFPLIYFLILSSMGARHYHYLTPLVPLFALNIARIDLLERRKQYKFEAYLGGLLGLIYSLGAFALLFMHQELFGFSSGFVFIVLIFSSVSCWYVFTAKLFSWRSITPLAAIFVFSVCQFMSLSSLAAGGIVWSTNKDLKSLAEVVNSECKIYGSYVYGLASKDTTLLRFYLDNSYELQSLEGFSIEPKRCLVIGSSAKQDVSLGSYANSFFKIYFR